MAKLAIKGSEVRAKEIMELINTLAPGINTNGCDGSKLRMVYILDGSNLTEMPYSKSTLSDDVMVFEYKEFISKHPYKIDDVVKTIWGNIGRITSMGWNRDLNSVIYELNNSSKFYSTNNIFTYEPEYMNPVKSSSQESTEDDLVDLATSIETDKAKAPTLVGSDYSDRRYGYPMPKDYEFDKVENGIIYLKPIKTKYPTTYEECTEILGECADESSIGFYKGDDLSILQKLLVCRDAYRKIDEAHKVDDGEAIDKYLYTIVYDEIGELGVKTRKDEGIYDFMAFSFSSVNAAYSFLKNFNSELKYIRD